PPPPTLFPYTTLFRSGIIGRDEETIAFGADYLRVASTSMSFTALSMVASRTLLAANDSWSPMVVRAGGALLNIGLNAVFIFVLEDRKSTRLNSSHVKT